MKDSVRVCGFASRVCRLAVFMCEWMLSTQNVLLKRAALKILGCPPHNAS